MRIKELSILVLFAFLAVGSEAFGQSVQKIVSVTDKNEKTETVLSKEHKTDMLLFNQTFHSTDGKPVQVKVDYRRTVNMNAEQKKALEANPERYIIINKPE